MNVYRCLAAMLLLLAWTLCHAASTQYYYDDLGRIVQAVRSDGAVFQYQYDANGNVLAINRISATSVSIAELTPRIGHAGATLTISGTGFSATPSQNTVTFNGGALAVVTSASPTTLAVTVPQAAQTGPVSVTVSGNTATSAMSYTVRRPAITSFMPLGVNAGGSVTIVGSSFNLVPGGTSINVGGVIASITSISNTQATFTPGAGSTHGVIEIITPYGSATSASALIIAPSGLVGGNIASTGVLSVNGSPAGVTAGAANNYGVYTFQGTASQYLSFHVVSLTTTPANQSLQYRVYSPTGALIAQGGNGTVSAAQKSHYLPKLPVTGTYILAFHSTQGGFQLSLQLIEDARLQANGIGLSAATQVVGHGRRFIISATAGQPVGFAVTSVVTAPNTGGITQTVSVWVNKPNGDLLFGGDCYTFSVPGCSWTVRSMPATGDYALFVVPVAQVTTSYSLTLSPGLIGTLELDVPQTLSLDTPAKPAVLTFTASANQTVAFHVSGITTTPAGKAATIQILNASGAEVARFSTATQATVNLRNLAAGIYTVQVDIASAATGSVQVQLASGLTGVLLPDGVGRPFASSVPGQAGYFTFNAAAGDNLAIAITNMATVPASGTIEYAVVMPNGNSLFGTACAWNKVPGCSWNMRNLPATGTYRVAVAPVGQRTMSFALTLSHSVTGTLTLGVAMPIDLAAAGQHAVLNFTATVGQSLTVTASSIATVPANKAVVVKVLGPNGSQVGGTGSGTSTSSVPLSNLAASTYTVLIFANDAATATMQVTVQ